MVDGQGYFELDICFEEALVPLLRGRWKGQSRFTLAQCRRASVKDIIESTGIPHTEIGRITCEGLDVRFSYIPVGKSQMMIYDHVYPRDVTQGSLLYPEGLEDIRFAVDVNVSRLAPLLRMAGFDTFYTNPVSDGSLAAIASSQGRILLSRDQGLLKRKNIPYGRLIREQSAPKQLREVFHAFGLKAAMQPFTRCLSCNGHLQPVAKEQILDRLEPLTRKFYHRFCRCQNCRKIYWSGSHRGNMLAQLDFACT